MKYLSLFSGIEAASCAWEPLGWHPVAFSEIEPFPCSLLKHRFPNVPNLGDVTRITEKQIADLGPIDLVIFGSPCQDLSVAGNRRGLDGERSGLFIDAMRIIRWARKYNGLRFALWENVPGAFSSQSGRDFAVVAGEMAGTEFGVPRGGWKNTGVAVGPNGLVEWGCLDAQFFGVPQRRRRVFALADSGNWRDRGPILLESQRLRRDSEAGGKERETTAASAGDGTAFNFQALGQYEPARVGRTLSVTHIDECSGSDLVVSATGPITQLTARHDGSEDGSGRGTPIIPFDTTQITSPDNHSNPKPGHPCHTLAGGAHAPAILFEPRSPDGVPRVHENICPTLKTMGGSTEDGCGRGTPILAATLNTRARHIGTDGLNKTTTVNMVTPLMFEPRSPAIIHSSDTAPAMTSSDPPYSRTGNQRVEAEALVATPTQVRRLTPTECERLQGFPDGWTNVPHRGKPAADAPRYKSLGNSMAVPVIRWIGERIDSVKKGVE